jgi:hypothetical protein
MKVTVLHYVSPPVVGSVEQAIYCHALELTRAGHAVHIVAGSGELFNPWTESIRVLYTVS